MSQEAHGRLGFKLNSRKSFSDSHYLQEPAKLLALAQVRQIIRALVIVLLNHRQ
jgi:hypothetical protein